MDAYDLGLRQYPPDDDQIWNAPVTDWPEETRPSFDKICPDCGYVTDVGPYGHGPYEDMGGGPHDHLRCFNMRLWWRDYYPYCVDCGIASNKKNVDYGIGFRTGYCNNCDPWNFKWSKDLQYLTNSQEEKLYPPHDVYKRRGTTLNYAGNDAPQYYGTKCAAPRSPCEAWVEEKVGDRCYPDDYFNDKCKYFLADGTGMLTKHWRERMPEDEKRRRNVR